MVPVVPSLTDGKYVHNGIVRGRGFVIVRFIAPEMGGGIYEECKVQDTTVPERTGYKNGVPIVFAPVVMGDLAGEKEREIKAQDWIT